MVMLELELNKKVIFFQISLISVRISTWGEGMHLKKKKNDLNIKTELLQGKLQTPTQTHSIPSI